MGNVVVQEEQPASAEEQRLRTGAAFAAARPRYKLILRPMKGEMHAELWPIIQLGQQPEGRAAATALDSNINKHSIAVLYVLSFPPTEKEKEGRRVRPGDERKKKHPAAGIASSSSAPHAWAAGYEKKFLENKTVFFLHPPVLSSLFVRSAQNHPFSRAGAKLMIKVRPTLLI
jgi:hypothetical protein